LAILCVIVGCAPTQFAPAIAYYAEKTAVTNAAARHTKTSPFYRFDTALLSDLDDAIACPNDQTQRELAAAALRSANELSQTSTANEIERMPAPACENIARIAGVSADRLTLQQHFASQARVALEGDLQEVDRIGQSELRSKLTDIRKRVAVLPDDKDRLARKLLYAWAAPMTALGIAKEESHIAEKCVAMTEKTFDCVALWRPQRSDDTALIAKYAPIIGVEWPAQRGHGADVDRVGRVGLSRIGKSIEVSIDPSAPTIYAYTSAAKIDGRRFRQLNYVWWFSERPEMVKNDPVAGRIDGSVLRITLDVNDKPMFVESSLNCGCAHEVFVANKIELAAREAFGTPLNGKRFAVEKTLPDKHDVVVVDTFDVGSQAGRPLVLLSAGYHEVCQVKFDSSEQADLLEIKEEITYQLADYGILDALPLGGGIASMFGPDGLVHHAGRPEGFLLVPSGILSAGQPRKRGTQRIRWDDHLHDDPHLLENTLRIPKLD
jgi:hypothetical protein